MSAACRDRIQWLGNAGHFVCADRCLFHLHTHIGGRFCISTVGDFYPDIGRLKGNDRGAMARMNAPPGQAMYYETFVFLLKDDVPSDELESDRYETCDEAQAGHEKLVNKYARLRRDAVIKNSSGTVME